MEEPVGQDLARPHADAAASPSDVAAELAQARERLHWTPRERLQYLVDMIAFEARARRARRLGPLR